MSYSLVPSKRSPNWLSKANTKFSKKEETDDVKFSVKSQPIQPPPLSANHGVERISFAPGTRVSQLSPQYLQRVTQERSRALALQGRRIVGIPLMLNDGIVLHWVHDPSKHENVEGTLPWRIAYTPSPLIYANTSSGSASQPPTGAISLGSNGTPQPSVDFASKLLEPTPHSNGAHIDGKNYSGAITVTDSDDEDQMVYNHASMPPEGTLDPHPTEEPIINDGDSDIEIVSWSLNSARKRLSPIADSSKAAALPPITPLEDEHIHHSSGSNTRAVSSTASRQSTLPVSRSQSPPYREKVLAPLYGDWGCLDSDQDVDPSSDGEYDPPAIQSSTMTDKGKSRAEPGDNPFDILLRLAILSDAQDKIAPKPLPPRGKSTVTWRESSASDEEDEISETSSRHGRTPMPQENIPSTSRPVSRTGKHTPPVSRGKRKSGQRPREIPNNIVDGVHSVAVPPNMKKVALPKTPYGRSRRILVPSSDDLPLATVTMRGDIQFIDRKEHFRISLSSLPNVGGYRHVEDACVVEDTIVLGYNGGPCQISLLPVTKESPRAIDIRRTPHVQFAGVSSAAKGGISCLTSMPSEAGAIKFFSGGHDRWIYMWTAQTHHLSNAACRKLSVFHDSVVSAIGYQPRSNALVSSSGQKLWTTDLSRSSTQKPVLVSNTVNQIHVHPQAQDIILLEIKHLDQQIQIFDSRKGGFNRPPCVAFGHRFTDEKFEPSYTKGSTRHVYFARGQDDSVVLWDYRNLKNAVIKRHYQQIDAVVHTAFSNSEVVAFGGRKGGGVVTFLGDYLHSDEV